MIIKNAKVITWGKENELLEGQAVHFHDGKIKDIGTETEILNKFPQDEVHDANGQYLMPGNICAHTHFYGAYSRGMAIPGEPAKDFPEILQKLWWPLDKALDEKSVRASVMVHLIDAIKHGTTTLVDHHASPNFINGSLDTIAESVLETGLRSVLCYEVTDRDGQEKSDAGIAENIRFLAEVGKDKYQGKIGAMFGMHASMTLEEATLEKCKAVLPEGAGFHIHVAEHESDQNDSLDKYGERVINRLQRHGILGENSMIAHGIHLTDEEIEILAETQTWVTHQPRSNMNNGVGVAEIEKLLVKGIKVCLGNDGFTQDMWAEWKIAYLLHKAWHRDPRRMNGMDVAKMAVENNSALVSKLLNLNIGEVAVGAAADLILVDYHPNTSMTTGNLPWHILFGFNESMVTSTIVDGEFLMKDRMLLNIDEEKVLADSRALAPEVWERYNKFVG
jgi:putative selenium metabolism protein SsnA